LQSKLEAQTPLAPQTPQTEIVIPTTCSCGTPLVDGDTHLYCPNENCPKRLLHRIKKWIEVLDIREIGEKLLIQLFEKGKVRDIADFYKLTAAELAEFERMGELSSEKVIKNLHAKRELSLESFVAGFDFYGIGEGFMERVVSTGYNTLEKLRNADSEQLAGVFGLGKITAQTLAAGLAETAAEMDAVLAAGIISIAPPPDINALPLIGRSFCFTGELKTMKRNDAVQKVKTLGGSIKAAIVKDLNYLVTNDTTSGSSKNKKAAALGIPIISEEDFLKLIQTG
jgi:DNA ligase (NAD+)